MKKYYLDSNAHVPMCPEAIKAFVDYQNSDAGYGHASSPSYIGKLAATELEKARGEIAILLGTKPHNLIFTSTCTQACEWACNIIKTQAERFGKQVKISPFEHPAIRFNFSGNTKLSIQNGIINEFGDKDDFIACLQVQNEVGTIQPIEKIEGFLLSDMCQSVGKIPINLDKMNVNLATFAGHKFGGSAAVGILYIKNIKLWEEFGVGSRYFMDRVGTSDVGSVVATATALKVCLSKMSEKLGKMKAFQSRLEEILKNYEYDVICYDVSRVSSTTTIKILNLAFNVLNDLSEKGIYIGVGSACSSKHVGANQTMEALGIHGSTSDFIRISQDGNYDAKDAEIVAGQIIESVKKFKR